jgi:hypothetical protein
VGFSRDMAGICFFVEEVSSDDIVCICFFVGEASSLDRRGWRLLPPKKNTFLGTKNSRRTLALFAFQTTHTLLTIQTIATI